MVSFADFMTLLFALFVVLFAISNVDEDKLEEVADSVQTAFGVMDHSGSHLLPHPGGKTQPIAAVVRQRKQGRSEQEQQDKALVKRLEKLVQQQAGLSASVALRREARGVVLQLQDNLLFDSGSASLKPRARQELKSLAQELNRLQQPIRVEGHTDNVPLGRGGRSNWELSAERATSVLRFLLDATALPPDSFSVAGYGEFHPIASNATPAGRAKNRRVDIVILNTEAVAEEPASPAATPLEQELERNMTGQQTQRKKGEP